MKQIVFEKRDEEILFEDVNAFEAIFIKKDGILIGMVIHDAEYDKWSSKLGAHGISDLNYKYFSTLEKCIKAGMDLGYEYYASQSIRIEKKAPVTERILP